MWRGQEEKQSLSCRAITQSAYSQTADSGAHNLFRTASVPDVVGRNPKTAFSSITIAARKVVPSLATSKSPSAPKHPVAASPKLPEAFGKEALSVFTSEMRVSSCHLDMCRQNPTSEIPNGFRQNKPPADGPTARDPEKRKGQNGLCLTERDRQDVIGGSSRPFYRSCIHHEVPLRSSRSVVFLDKSLSISLVDLERRRAGQPTLYTTTFSLRFGVSPCCRFSTDKKSAKINEGYQRPRVAMLGTDKRNGQGSSLGHSRSLLIKQQGCKVEQIAPAHGVNSKSDDSDTQRHSSTWGLLSFRGPSPSNTKTGRQKGNADEATLPTRNNFRHQQHTFNIGPGMNLITFLQRSKSQLSIPIDLNIPRKLL